MRINLCLYLFTSIRKIPPGKLSPEKFLPIKFPLGEFPPGKFPPIILNILFFHCYPITINIA